MKRVEAKIRNKEREQIEEITKQPSTSTLETDESTITKLLAGKSYDKEDIVKCAKNLLPKYGHDSEQQFFLIENIDKLTTVFEDIQIEAKKPIFVIFGKPKNRWVLFCLIQDQDGKNRILYKDPCGSSVSFKLELKLREKIPDIVFVVQTQKEQEVEDENSYGPLTVRNLKVLLDFLRDETDVYFEKFPELEFSHLSDLNHVKNTKVITSTTELGENEEFKAALKDFIDKLPLDLGSGMLEYKNVMEEELEKDEDEVDLERIRKAREQYMHQENIKKFQDDYKLNKEEVDGEVKAYELDIQKNFPEEMKKLADVFTVLDNIKVDEQLFAALENISEILNIDPKKMKSFYEFKLKEEERSEDEKLSSGDVDSIVKNLPTMKETSVTDDSTPLDQLLSEIILGMDQGDTSPSQSQEEIGQLLTKYHMVKNKYETWKNSDLKALNNWATKIKGHLGTSDDDICETIAIMDKVLNLLTGGHRLRDTQILAVLIFFHESKTQGRLCQIKTGEGKTIIVSLLAVIRALQGHTVDVITSNLLLAADGVDETKTFYSAFGLTVSTNNPADGSRSDFKIGYTADVLYGTISNFQFDFLKDSFEGFNIRRQRRFGQVILDEVDSMLVDNGGHIAKLASPYPGMESLRYIYIKIWQELRKAEESFVRETQEKVKEFLATYPDKDEARLHYEKFIQEMTNTEQKIIKEKIKASNPTDVPLIPAHLKEYVSSKLKTWIKNAVHAKYNCHEHQQYRIITNDAGERVITPVDYLNTGVTLKNTIWSNGLHQFVQLKHNLYLTFESLTSSFISNIGYIKNYDDKNIFGLTGTLGSRAEQQLLSQIYNINYAKLPTYKQKKFEELPGVISEDSAWATQLTLEVIEKIEEGRAVLVICETEQDLLTVKKNLEILQDDNFRIRMYANEDNADETEEKVKIGDIILATNIAGRGTNFRTEKTLETNGGLHVCVGFLPCNLRVEGQAFGRTSRQGNNGTAQLIIRSSEVEELGITGENPDFTEIKKERDRLERDRLEEINNVLVKELNFKDELFSYFSEFHRNLKQDRLTRAYMYVLQDLKEFWAFWLEKNNFKAKTIVNTTPRAQFEMFLKEAQSIIDGNISHNPFYCIALADHYLEKNSRGKAASILKHALQMGGNSNYELLAGAHLKLFEVAIADGEQVMERFKKAIAKVFFVDVSKNEAYKSAAMEQLNHAKQAIEKEINYVENYLTDRNPDFGKILQEEQEKNLFLKHIYSRLYCLKLHHGNIEQLIDQINTIHGGVDINGKAPTTVKNFNEMAKDAQIKESELTELQSIGVDAIYSLKEIYDVSDVIIHAAQGQIGAGIASLIIGLCFMPVFPIMSSIGGMLISEGIMDIVMELITQGSSEFNANEYMKGKFISYGVSLITFGISALSQSVKILTKAVSFCRKLSSFLRKSSHLKGLCNKLAKLVDRLGDVLEKMLTVAKFNKLSKANQLDELTKLQQSGNLDKFEHLGGLKKLNELQDLQKIGKLRELTRGELLVDFAKNVTLTTGKNIAKTIIEKEVIKPLLSMIFKDIIEKIKSNFKDSLRSSIRSNENLMSKLQTSPADEITEAVDDFNKTDEALTICKEVGFALLGAFNNPVIDALTLTYDTIKNTVDLGRYMIKFVPYLENELKDGDADNDVGEIVEEICTIAADRMFSLWCDIFKGQLTGVKMVIGHVLDRNLKKGGDIEERIIVSPNKPIIIKEDAYQIVGVRSDATLSEITTQYRRMALQLHPDKNPNDPYAKENFQKLLNAYEEIVKNKKSN